MYELSDANEDWFGVPYPEDWMLLAISAEEARAWDMDLVLAEPWIDMGCQPEQAHACLDAGLEAGDVEWWLGKGFLVEDVAEAFVEGGPVPLDFRPDDAETWLDAGHSLTTAFWFMRAGISVDEAAHFTPRPRLEAFVHAYESSA